MIYHYCAIDSFVPIINSKQLWMSDLEKMNDPSEYNLGFNIVISKFGEIYPEHVPWLKYRHAKHSNRVLSTSFTKQGDMLSQWRAYASNGSGVSLGFDIEALLDINKHIQSDEVNYSKNFLIEKAYELISKHKVSESSFVMKGFNTYDISLAHELSKLSIFYKSEFYREEEEVRLVAYLSDDSVIHSKQTGNKIEDGEIQFRVSKYGLVPYMGLQFCCENKNALREVIIGPNSSFSPKDVKLLLECNHLTGVKVVSSNGNYR